MEKRADGLLSFLEETTDYFLLKVKSVNKDRYFADRDIRYILDKAINDIILCLVDLSEEVLKKHQRAIPDTYKDTILGCYDFMGDIALKVAPLTKHRNEAVHQYLKINWQNILSVKEKIPDIKAFAGKAKELLK